jgi:hypothetical protein
MVNLSSVSPMKMGKGCKERRSLKEKVHQVSISPTFYEQLFHMKVACAAFCT